MKNLIHNILKILLISLVILLVLALIIWGSLKHGISINRVAFSGITAEKLNVKHDQGFLISIDSLNIMSGTASETPSNPGPYISRFNSLAHRIRKIQINQILHRDQDTLKHKLEELILKIEQEGDALREHTEIIRNEMSRYRDLPEHLKRSMDELKDMQSALQSYLSNVKEGI